MSGPSSIYRRDSAWHVTSASSLYRGETLNTLGEVALARGDYEQAEQHLQEGLSLARQFGVPEYLTKNTREPGSAGTCSRRLCAGRAASARGVATAQAVATASAPLPNSVPVGDIGLA